MSGFLKALLILSFLTGGQAWAGQKKTIENFIIMNVDKTAMKAELRTWPVNWKKSKLLKSFKIAIGKAEGDKQKEGDNKTPEGVYFTQRHIPGKSLPKKYGPKAIPLNFPNPIDRSSGKTGHGIWLHGVDDEKRIEEAKVTEGCVAFYNPDIVELGNWLRPKQGVIMIMADGKGYNRKKDLQKVAELTQTWANAWSERDVDAYTSFYSSDFRYKKMNLDAYKTYKKRVFRGYKKMVVKVDKIRVLSHPKYAISFFNQDFNGDNRFISDGRKILYWNLNDQGKWKIVGEVFEKMRFEPVSYTEDELAHLAKEEENQSSSL